MTFGAALSAFGSLDSAHWFRWF